MGSNSKRGTGRGPGGSADPRASADLTRWERLARAGDEPSPEQTTGIPIGDRPLTALERLGLIAALRLEARGLELAGWRLVFHAELGPGRLAPALESCLFSIGREALANVRRSGEPTLVSVRCRRRGAVVRLEVCDWPSGPEQGPGGTPRLVYAGACPEAGATDGVRQRSRTVVVAEVALDGPGGV